jgi:hypothetical protein
MTIPEQINAYIAAQPEPKRGEMETLHQLVLQLNPECRLWFLDGKDGNNKVVSNPNIGYGAYMIHYANGSSKEFYRVGLSANTVGISVYIMGISDKGFLAQTFGEKLGKASVSGYCIKFKTLKDIHLDVLEAAMRYGIEQGDTRK